MNSLHLSSRILAVVAGSCLATLFPAAGSAATIDLTSTATNTATDNGPQDGAFDAFVSAVNLGLVVNNGYTSFRTAFEFALAPIPSGATINTATLTLQVNWVEGTRSLHLHGYRGDGAISLGDMAAGSLVSTATIGPSSTVPVVFDVTTLVQGLTLASSPFAGLTLREEPPQSPQLHRAGIRGGWTGGTPADRGLHPGRHPGAGTGRPPGNGALTSRMDPHQTARGAGAPMTPA